MSIGQVADVDHRLRWSRWPGELRLGWPCRRSDGDELPPGIVTSDDARYSELTRGWNQRWTGHPEQVRLLASTRQVVDAVEWAVAAGKRFTVRSGGHCYEDFVDHPEVDLVLDLSPLNQVSYDPRHNAISVGAGVPLGSLYNTLYRMWGVTIPGAMCASVGAGGHIVGGGYGPLSRRFGLTVDYLYGVEVVVVDKRGRARTVVATRDLHDRHRDLWWAHTGGGGGNFGVVTRYLLKRTRTRPWDPSTFLPRPPSQVLLSAVALNWADMEKESLVRLVRNFSSWHERNSDPDSPYLGISGSLKLYKKTFDDKGNPGGQVLLLTQADATEPEARDLLDDYLTEVFDGVRARRRPWTSEAGDTPPLAEYFEPQTVPWLRATALLGSAPAPARADVKSASLRTAPTAAQLDVMYAWLATKEYSNPDALLRLDSYGGRINTVAPEATAAVHRDSVLALRYQVSWADPDEDEWHVAWLRGFYRAVYAETGGVPVRGDGTDGCFVNYPDVDLGDPEWNTSDVPWFSLYYGNNYPLLQEIQSRYDPCGVFRHTQSVEPA